MKQTEYEQKRAECWEEFKNEVFNGNISYSPYGSFDFAFDRAYALGKQTETITKEDAEKTAQEAVREEYFCEKCLWKDDCAFCGGQNTAFDCCECPADSFKDGFMAGANFALDKQEKDADTVIQGWVCRDRREILWTYEHKPMRNEGGGWSGRGAGIALSGNLFPDLTWKSDPEPVEIILKRKKK